MLGSEDISAPRICPVSATSGHSSTPLVIHSSRSTSAPAFMVSTRKSPSTPSTSASARPPSSVAKTVPRGLLSAAHSSPLMSPSQSTALNTLPCSGQPPPPRRVTSSATRRCSAPLGRPSWSEGGKMLMVRGGTRMDTCHGRYDSSSVGAAVLAQEAAQHQHHVALELQQEALGVGGGGAHHHQVGLVVAQVAAHVDHGPVFVAQRRHVERRVHRGRVPACLRCARDPRARP
jgi:hypothetical protein